MRLIVLILLLVAAWPVAAQPRGSQGGGQPIAPPLPWVDVHLHLVGGGNADFAGAAGALMGEMDKYGVAFALVMPPPQVRGQRDQYDQSSYAAVLRRYPQRFGFLAGGGALNSIIHAHADAAKLTDAVVNAFKAEANKLIDAGAIGFGEIAALHLSAVPGHPYESVPADHPLIQALAEVAVARDVPIDLHMDALEADTPAPPRFQGGANPAMLPATIPSLERLLAAHPKARIVWAHGGSDPLGGMAVARLDGLMAKHANLFVHLRVYGPNAPFQNKVLGPGGLDPDWLALLTRFPDRFLIGTDSFIVAPSMAGRGGGPGMQFAERNAPKYQATLHLLSQLPPTVQAAVASGNARRIYKLEGRVK